MKYRFLIFIIILLIILSSLGLFVCLKRHKVKHTFLTLFTILSVVMLISLYLFSWTPDVSSWIPKYSEESEETKDVLVHTEPDFSGESAEQGTFKALHESMKAKEKKEYREVRAKDILKQIENGEDVNLTYCRIVGELNLSTIELEEVINPNQNELLEYYDDSYNERFGFDQKLRTINSNITINNSILENDLDFSHVFFKKPISLDDVTYFSTATFTCTYFNDTVNFDYSTFNDTADFSFATFNNTARLWGVAFNDNVHFKGATFNDAAIFQEGTFENYANFEDVNFNDNANFGVTTFNGVANFKEDEFNNFTFFEQANSKKSINFNGADFGDYAGFRGATLYGTANFDEATFIYTTYEGPETPENIVSDGINYNVFMKYYEDEGRYDDSDVIYYNYRKKCQAEKKWYEISKWTDFITWLTCGYGVRPLHTLYLGGTLIILFSIIYAKGPVISLDTISNKKIPLRFYFQGPGILMRTESHDSQPQKVSFRDALYFSVNTFTTVGHANWYPKENFKKWATLEGLLGWIILGIFMATLTAVMIRI